MFSPGGNKNTNKAEIEMLISNFRSSFKQTIKNVIYLNLKAIQMERLND